MAQTIQDKNNPGLSAGDVLHGYRIERIAVLEEISSVYYELQHLETGAKYVHISNEDKENTFSVAFKTVPADSTGVAHILEHTALCGSARFPVRDPFFSMIKRSLNTFMNAFTASDWTMYPFSTENRKDFYNLMDVYLDAAFFPDLNELSFKQEGHRLEFETGSDGAEEKLVYKGVVYNEMKGAMSSVNQVMARSLMNALYPDTTYSCNSGGEPSDIPGLTIDDLRAFHKVHYHPSNSFFFTYGNLPLSGHLEKIQHTILGKFDRIDPGTTVMPQPRWEAPREVTYTYPLGGHEDPKKKFQVSVAWLTADIQNSFDILSLIILGDILLGNSASPMRKALIDSGLGSSMCDATGFDADNRDSMMAFGLKDVAEESAEKIESIIFDVLKDLSENGIDRTLIDSAIHQLEFHRKEVTNTPYPYGIKLLLSFAGSWFHGGDPVRNLVIDTDLGRMRQAIEKGGFFESLIKKYFLENRHRVRFVLAPDQTMEQKEAEREARELLEKRKVLTEGEIAKIRSDTEALKRLQEAEEDLSCLPTLNIGDIPPQIKVLHPSSVVSDINLKKYVQPTSGILYFASAAGAGAVPERLIPLVPFFCSTFTRVGTKLHDYAEMARKVDACTGGIGLSSSSRTLFDGSGACLPFVSLRGKCLNRNTGRMFDLIEEFVTQYDFSDLSRLKSLLMEFRAGIESSIVQVGHRLAIGLASRNFSQTGALDEKWHGIHQFRYIKHLTEDLNDDKLKVISEDLREIAGCLFKSLNFQSALVGDENIVDSAVTPASKILDFMDKGNSFFVPPQALAGNGFIREGWSTHTSVSFVASALKTVRMDHEDAPALSVISKLMRSQFLHREIREKGGAYGGFALYSAEDGIFCMASYRDPHIGRTLDVFGQAAEFIRSGAYSEEDVKEAILQKCSEIDKPLTPGQFAVQSFYRDIIRLSDDSRKAFKENLLTLDRKRVLEVAEKYFTDIDGKQSVAVISGEDKLKGTNEKLVDNPLTLHRI